MAGIVAPGTMNYSRTGGGGPVAAGQYPNYSPTNPMPWGRADNPEWATNTARTGYGQRQRSSAEVDFQRQLDTLDAARTERLLKTTGWSGGGGGGAPTVPKVPIAGYSPGGGPPGAAEGAAFGRAKDRIGEASQGALSTLGDIMSSRGLSGTGIEAGETGRVIGEAQRGIGEAGRDIALQQERRAAEVADRNLAALLQQRGQDIGQRGQDIGAEQSRRDQILALIRAQQARNYLF